MEVSIENEQIFHMLDHGERSVKDGQPRSTKFLEVLSIISLILYFKIGSLDTMPS